MQICVSSLKINSLRAVLQRRKTNDLPNANVFRCGLRISIRGSVRPSVRRSVRPSVRHLFLSILLFFVFLLIFSPFFFPFLLTSSPPLFRETLFNNNANSKPRLPICLINIKKPSKEEEDSVGEEKEDDAE